MAKKYPAQNFLNRELGLLEFNRRVLAQAEDATVPLLERLKYLCIVSSNLVEFFEIRVAGLKEQAKLGGLAFGPDGLKPHRYSSDCSHPHTSSLHGNTSSSTKNSSLLSHSKASSSCAARTGTKHKKSG